MFRTQKFYVIAIRPLNACGTATSRRVFHVQLDQINDKLKYAPAVDIRGPPVCVCVCQILFFFWALEWTLR